MKKKLIGALFAAMLLVALPSAAFAANSGSVTGKSLGGGVTADCTGNTLATLVVTPPSSTGGLGTYDVTFSDNTTSGFGNLTLTFTVGTQYNGQTCHIIANHSDGTTESWDKTVTNGTVSVTVTKLSTFTLSIGSGSSNTSATSPKTGVDLNMVGFATLATVIAAGGVFWALRKQDQR